MTLAVVAAGVSAALSLVLPWLLPAGSRFNDLAVYEMGGQLATSSHGLYAAATGAGYPFTYPPFAALVFTGLHALGGAATAVWSGLSVLALAVCCWLVAERLDLPQGRRCALVVAAAGLFVVAAWLMPVRNTLRFGQINLLLLLMVLVDVLEMDRIPRPLRGVMTGIAAGLKLTPAVFVLGLWAMGRRRDSAQVAVTAALTVAIGWLFLPGDSVTYWFGKVGDVSRYGRVNALGDQSVHAALTRAGLAGHAVTVASAVVAVAALAAAMMVAHRCRSDQSLGAVAALGAGMLLASPVAWTHHYVWLLPAIPALAFRPGRSGRLVAAVLAFGLVLSPTGVLGRVDMDIALAVIALGALSRPVSRDEPTAPERAPVPRVPRTVSA